MARPRLEAVEAVEAWDPLEASGAAKLHAMNHKGRGTRVAVIDGDFSGWARDPRGMCRGGVTPPLQGGVTPPLQGGVTPPLLPGDTIMVDLTRARNDDLQPDPDPGEVGAGSPRPYGHGARMALAVMRAAPEAELVLVRIDPAAPYMLQEVARAMNREPIASDSLANRRAHLEAVRSLLDQEQIALRAERRAFLGAVRGPHPEGPPPQEEGEDRPDGGRGGAAQAHSRI